MNLAASLSGTTANLSWSASTDNVVVTGYQVFQGTTLKGTTASTVYAVSSLAEGQTHTFTVKAFDAVNNLSGSSNSASVTVPSAPPPADTTAPSVPVNLVASVSGSNVSLSWNASTDNVGVTGYDVMHNSTLLGSSATTSYVHAATAGTTYNYTARAKDAAQNISNASSVLTVTVPLPPVQDSQAPSTPTGVTAVYSNSAIQMNWNPSTDNVGVALYKVINDPSQIGTSATTSYVITSPVAGSTYRLTTQACDTAGNCSWWGNIAVLTVPTAPPPADTTVPSNPLNLAASLSGTTANLSWSASTDNVGVTGYQVFQGTTLKGTTASTGYSVASLTQGQSYSFSVKAFDAANNVSGLSNTVTVNVPLPPDTTAPSAPANLVAFLSGNSVSISWSSSSGATGYALYRNGTLLVNTASASATDSTVSPGQTYAYTVRAYDVAGNYSGYSNSMSVTIPQALTPTAPTKLKADSSPTSVGPFVRRVTLEWVPGSNNVGFEIYRNGVFRTTSTTNSATDEVGKDTTVRYKVRAYNSAGEFSPFSAELTFVVR